MTFTKLIPNIFYSDISTGLNLFVNCLQFEIAYQEVDTENPFYVLKKDGLVIHLIQNKEFADKDRPELRLETDSIDTAYAEIRENYPELLHPNLRTVTLRPWNAKEFALMDQSGVCIVVQEWIK
jgi:hypothetical protein